MRVRAFWIKLVQEAVRDDRRAGEFHLPDYSSPWTSRQPSLGPAAAVPLSDILDAGGSWTTVTSRTRTQRASTSGSCSLRPRKDETAPRRASFADPCIPAALSSVTPCGGIAGG
eukprot:1244584-Pyramimonas_sp.AAC.1